MSEKIGYRVATKADYLGFFRELQDRCGDEYSHISVTGHFGVDGIEHSRSGYEQKWWHQQKNITLLHRKIARRFTNDRDWHERPGSMKAFIVPEVQQNLHWHGVISLPFNVTDEDRIRIGEFGNEQWKKLYKKGHFHVDEVRDDGWDEYMMKKQGYGDIIANCFIVLPPSKRK